MINGLSKHRTSLFITGDVTHTHAHAHTHTHTPLVRAQRVEENWITFTAGFPENKNIEGKKEGERKRGMETKRKSKGLDILSAP